MPTPPLFRGLGSGFWKALYHVIILPFEMLRLGREGYHSCAGSPSTSTSSPSTAPTASPSASPTGKCVLSTKRTAISEDTSRMANTFRDYSLIVEYATRCSEDVDDGPPILVCWSTSQLDLCHLFWGYLPVLFTVRGCGT
jgi:hypothetical protein